MSKPKLRSGAIQQGCKSKTAQNKSRVYKFIFHGAIAANGPGPPRYRRFTVTLRHTILGRTPLDEWSARRRPLHEDTQHSKVTRIHASSGIRTHNLSKRTLDRAATGVGGCTNMKILTVWWVYKYENINCVVGIQIWKY